MTGHVDLALDGSIARVTLSHPGKLNAMSRAMWVELGAIFQRVHSMGEVRCVVVAGDGGDFCAGGDISEYPHFRFDEKALAHFHENEVWGGLRSMLECDVPIVAAIGGACIGGGLEIASCCDIRIAGESAKFGAPIAKLGFPMAPREAAIVATAIGDATARELLLEASTLAATEMKARGFLQRVVPDADVIAAAQDSAQKIASFSPQAARLNKQSLRALNIAASGLDVNGAYSYADSHEHREGVTAFLEKRKPSF
jgi:enoyl-CoA hydratase/carnithine racemase